MNLKALITSLTLLGTSSLAMARPGTTSASAQVQVSAQATVSFGSTGRAPAQVRDHRQVRPAPPPPPVQAQTPTRATLPSYWDTHAPRHQRPDAPRPASQLTLLSDALTFGTTEYRKDIYPEISTRFSRVLIQSNGGQTFVHEVRVMTEDLQWITIPVRETLSGREQIVLPLGTTKGIRRIHVYRADGDAAHNMNQRHQGSFLVSAL